MNEEENIERLDGQPCPMCGTSNLSLMEAERDIPYFGKVYVFSMSCNNCKYHQADVECVEVRDPARYTFEISGEEDMHVRVVKSSQATVKIPHVITIDPGPVSNGYVTNIEGVLNRVKNILEKTRDTEDDDGAKKKAKNMLKKLNRVMWGREKLKIIIEDPSGNSAIISDKAEVSKLKK